MAPQQPHNKLIAQAARAVLGPMGLRQQGRSRIWLDDNGWWLGVVEFQPSSWSKGSYLNVGACWLWHPGAEPGISFDLGHRVEGHVPFRNEAQFQPQARRLADRAAEEIIRSTISSRRTRQRSERSSTATSATTEPASTCRRSLSMSVRSDRTGRAGLRCHSDARNTAM